MTKIDKKNNVIQSITFFVEKIIKPSGEEIFIVRGGSPQMPQTLFVGSPDEYCDFIHNM